MSMSTPALTFEAVRGGDHLPELHRTVTEEQVRAYAEASGDRNPIHLDEAFARAVGLPGIVAHGMLTMAFVAEMVTDWLGDRGKLRRLEGRFADMVQPGDEIRCTGTVTGIDAAGRRVSLTVEALNQHGVRVFTKGVAEAQF
jgi:acyl dehydratase